MTEYELYHASTRKHKYIKKIGNRYFYTQQEIAAYLKEKKNSANDMSFGTVTEYSAGKAKPIGVELRSDKRRVFNKKDAAAAYLIDEKGRPYTSERYNKKKGVYVKDKKITAYSEKDGSTNTRTIDLNKPKEAIDKKRRQIRGVKEAVAEATGRRDVYYEAKKVTENGRTYYDDDNAKLRTGKKDKKGRVDPEDGSVYTKKGTMQYDNEYTIERNKKTRARGKKKLKKMATAPVRTLQKQSSKGKKALDNWKKKRAPKVTVIQSISEDKNYKMQNGQRG